MIKAQASSSMRGHQIAAIARYTMLEAWRIRLLPLYVLVLALIWAVAFFLQSLAITESMRLAVAFAAAGTRLAAVCLLCLHVMTSITREFNDKGLELTLAFDLPRSHYILGRLAGFLILSALLAIIAALSELPAAPSSSVMVWAASLALELAIMAALSLFCVITLPQLIPAASFVFGFYLLARVLTAIRLMSETPLAGGDAVAHRVMSTLVDGLALILPRLDHFAQGSWLVDQAPAWPVLGANAVQSVFYVALLGAAAMFDFYRRNF
jgi:hypothetical protein